MPRLKSAFKRRLSQKTFGMPQARGRFITREEGFAYFFTQTISFIFFFTFTFFWTTTALSTNIVTPVVYQSGIPDKIHQHKVT